MPKTQSGLIRHCQIYRMYEELLEELGDVARGVSKGYIYDRIQERTGLSHRSIGKVINNHSLVDRCERLKMDDLDIEI